MPFIWRAGRCCWLAGRRGRRRAAGTSCRGGGGGAIPVTWTGLTLSVVNVCGLCCGQVLTALDIMLPGDIALGDVYP